MLFAAVLGVVVVSFLFFLSKLNIVAYIKKKHRKWKLLKDFPLPENIPYHWLLGHIPALAKQDEASLMAGVEEINKPENKDRIVRKTRLGFLVFLNIHHPKFLVEIFKEPKAREVYRLLIPWLGEGLLIANGKQWFRNRKLLTPAFHYEILRGYISVYNSCVSVLLKKWKESAQRGESVLLFNTLSSMSLDIIMQSAFSFKSNCQLDGVQVPYVQACSELIYLVTDRVMNPLYMIEGIYWLTPQGRRMKRACDFVHRHAEKVISERRSNLDITEERSTIKSEDSSEGFKKTNRYHDFLDVLLIARDEEGQGMSDLEIRNEVDTFMFEGHDTTTSAMSWTLYCLAKYPEHQNKVREEVRKVLQEREWLEYDDLKHLNYTMWCIKEAMRLYPPVFAYFRETTEEIKVQNLIIPSDTLVRIDAFDIHRNVNVWERPNEYDPLRFQPKNFDCHGPYDYIPFSAGNRNCIGQNFAMNEMKVVVGTVVSHFKLNVDEDHVVEIVPRIILRAKNDIRLHLTAI